MRHKEREKARAKVKDAKRAAHAILGETIRGRKRGPHRTAKQLKPNEWTDDEVQEHEKGVDVQEEAS